jgi:CheY-like chemotaxis protein
LAIEGAYRGITLIAAEDDTVCGFALARYAEMAGCALVIADNGLELLARMREGSFSLVLMDIEMPGMGGIETAARIRAGEAGEIHRKVPIIAMTGHSKQDYSERLRAGGMDGFLEKPVGYAEFTGALDRYAKLSAAPLRSREKALERVKGNEPHLRGLERIYSEDAPRRMTELEEALRIDDCATAGKAAHSLKGASLVIEARRCADAAGLVEKAAAAGDLARCRELARILRDELDSLLAELDGQGERV